MKRPGYAAVVTTECWIIHLTFYCKPKEGVGGVGFLNKEFPGENGKNVVSGVGGNMIHTHLDMRRERLWSGEGSKEKEEDELVVNGEVKRDWWRIGFIPTRTCEEKG